jgi:predicted transcriptional regulator
MSTLTITISEDRLAKLQEIADRFNIKPEDLARVSIEELLTRPEESFQQADDHILQKNADLYRRLV